MTLLLVRHGRSAHSAGWALLDRAGLGQWQDSYDRAGIAALDAPPPALVAEVAQASIIAASDLPRAIESATRLAPEREVHVSPLFREIPLPVPSWGLWSAPLAAWGAIIHLQWLADMARGRTASPEALEQARAAAQWCLEACTRPDDGKPAAVAVVTHGVFRRLLAQLLAVEGWLPAPGWRSYAHWSVWRFDAPGTRAADGDRVRRRTAR